MSENQERTLEDLEWIDALTMCDHELGHIIQSMQWTGHHKWGFRIYRCTYSDDEAWLRYVQYIKDQTISTLDLHDQRSLLEKYFDMQVVEGPELDGASKPYVKSLFADWAETHRRTEKGGPGSANTFATKMPRFNYCVYVDQACLDTLLTREKWDRELEQGDVEKETEMPPSVVCVVIAANCKPEGEGPDGYEPVEGCTRYFPGWMYCLIDLLTTLYEQLHFEDMSRGYDMYERPPGIAEDPDLRMPL